MNEREKYEAMWALPGYRKNSPGERDLARFLEVVKPTPGARIVDFGCGTGRAAAKLALQGFDVTAVDIAANALDDGVFDAFIDPPAFYIHDLREPLHFKADYGYCTDVMEHIPTEDVSRALSTIFAATPLAFFGIATRPDMWGSRIGETLHLTVRPDAWWTEQLAAHAEIEWSKRGAGESFFYARSKQ